MKILILNQMKYLSFSFIKQLLIVLIISISPFIYGQSNDIPTGYYDNAKDLSGYTLKTALHNIIDDHKVQSYSQLWTEMKTTDNDGVYEDDNTVLDMYSENPYGPDPYNYSWGADQCGTYRTEGNCYNREHSFPKSWFSKASPMLTDLFHIYPTDGKVNGQRSNWPFGEVASPTWTSENGSKLGPSSFSGYSGTVFEPIDAFKGDFARSYFYMATRYQDVIDGSKWKSVVLDGSTDKVYVDWYLDMILKWHINDSVSQKEIYRNDAVYGIQKNRNPFIDHPEYVSSIWGGNASTVFTNLITVQVMPENSDNVSISAAITDAEGISTVTLNWGIDPGSLTSSISMINTSDNNYKTISYIPAQVYGTVVYYQIVVVDTSNVSSSSPINSYLIGEISKSQVL